jgi:hypothetical protein
MAEATFEAYSVDCSNNNSFTKLVSVIIGRGKRLDLAVNKYPRQEAQRLSDF